MKGTKDANSFYEVQLIPIDNRKSFYGKASMIISESGAKFIKSYGTIVCGIGKNGDFERYWDGYSQTTQRHVNAFLTLCGKCDLCGKANWERMPVVRMCL